MGELMLCSRMVCVQYVYFIVNFIFVIVGTFFITIALVIESIPREFGIFMDWDDEPIRVLKLVGIALLVLSLIANFVSIKRSFLLFSTYGAFLLTLLTVEVNLAIRVFLTYDTCDSVIATTMLTTLKNYNTNNAKTWDYLQHNLHCCGVHNSSDWASYSIDGPETTTDGYTYTVPYSCCADFHCYNVRSTGCLNILSDYVSTASLTILCTIISIGFIKVSLLIFSCIIATTSNDVELDEETKESLHIRDVLIDRPSNLDLNAPSSSYT